MGKLSLLVCMPRFHLFLNNCFIVARTHSLLLLILFFVCSLVCFGFLFGSEGSNLFLSLPRRPRSGWNTKLTEHDKQTDEQFRMFLTLRKLSLRKLLLVLPESPNINFRGQAAHVELAGVILMRSSFLELKDRPAYRLISVFPLIYRTKIELDNFFLALMNWTKFTCTVIKIQVVERVSRLGACLKISIVSSGALYESYRYSDVLQK